MTVSVNEWMQNLLAGIKDSCNPHGTVTRDTVGTSELPAAFLSDKAARRLACPMCRAVDGFGIKLSEEECSQTSQKTGASLTSGEAAPLMAAAAATASSPPAMDAAMWARPRLALGQHRCSSESAGSAIGTTTESPGPAGFGECAGDGRLERARETGRSSGRVVVPRVDQGLGIRQRAWEGPGTGLAIGPAREPRRLGVRPTSTSRVAMGVGRGDRLG